MAGFKGYKRSIILDFNYDEVKKGIPDINKQMALLNAEFRKSSEQIKDTGTNLDKLGLQQDYLSTKIKLQKDKVAELTTELKKYSEAEGDNSKTVASKTIALRNAETQLIKLENELSKATKDTETFGKSTLDNVDKVALLNAEFAKSSNAAKLSGDKISELSAKHDFLTQKLNLQKDTIKQLEKELENLTITEKGNEKAINSKTIELKNAETQYSKLQAELKDTTKSIEEQKEKTESLATTWKDTTEKMKESGVDVEKVAGSMQKVGAAMMSIGVVGSGLSMSFDKTFSKVKTIADDTQVSFERLEKGVMDVSNNMNMASGDVANGLYEILSSNVETKDSLVVLNDSAKLAKAGFTDMGTSVDIMTTILNAYKLKVEDTTSVSDKLIMIQNLGKTTIGELGQDFGKVAGLAATAGQSLDQVGAAVSVLTSNGIQSNESITGLKAILSNIIKPSSEAAETAENLGIKFDVTALKSKGLEKFLADVQRRCHGNIETMGKLFGSTEALNAALILSGTGAKDFEKNLKLMENASGTTADALINVDNKGERFEKSLNALKNKLIETGDAFSPVITVVTGFITVLSKIPSGVLVSIAAIGSLLLIVGSVIKAIGTVATTIQSVKGVMDMFNTVTGHATFMTFAKWAGIIVLVTAAITALVVAINYLIGRGSEMNRAVSDISSAMSSTQGNMQQQINNVGKKSQGLATGTNFVKQSGIYRVNEYGEEEMFLERGQKVKSTNSPKNNSNINVNNSNVEALLTKVLSRMDAIDRSIQMQPDQMQMVARSN